MALFPAGREVPALECEVVRVQVQNVEVPEPRQWGACWLALCLWGPSGAGPVLAVPLAGDGCRRSDSQSGRTDARIAPARRTTYLHERLHIGPRSATTGTMTGTNKKLTAAVDAYCADLGRVRASGGATGERSSYGPLANLLNAIGAALKPKVFCVGELADQGVGHPDFGLYAVNQVQRGRPRKGQIGKPPRLLKHLVDRIR